MRDPLTIEIHGTGVWNRGGELMAIGIAQAMRRRFPKVRLAVPPNFGPYEDRARHRFYVTDEFTGRIRTKALLHYSPPGLRSALGLIATGSVQCVLDASGFAFSDQWGCGAAKALVLKMRQKARRKQPLVLLPQAFGPFENKDVRHWSRLLVDRASLVCARDSESFANLQKLGCNPSKLRKYPDFTIGLLPNQQLSGIILPAQFAAIVPNIRMLDKGGSPHLYIKFLLNAIAESINSGMEPVIVLHDNEADRQVVEALAEKGARLPVIHHPDPLVLKAVLGRATMVIGSRFHALVSAMAQGVPCVGAGWSHKYQELFNDFCIPEYLLKDLGDSKDLARLITKAGSADIKPDVRRKTLESAEKFYKESELMWNEVEQAIMSSGGS